MGAESHEALNLYNNAQGMLEQAAELQKEELATGQAILEMIVSAIVT